MDFVRIALDVPIPCLFEYRVASLTPGDIGRRVLVPFGRKVLIGVIVEQASTPAIPAARVRDVLAILRDAPALPSDTLEILRFCSQYYHHPLGPAILNSLPTRLRRREAVRSTPAHAGRYILNAPSSTLESPPRSKVQRDLLDTLRQTPGGVDESVLRRHSPRAMAAIRAMMSKGWVVRIDADPNSPPSDMKVSPSSVTSGPSPTEEQRAALAALRQQTTGFSPSLLLGVTGSGKTEIYLQLVADTLAAGKQALMMVPEINLTPQLEGLVRTRFPTAVLVSLHSGLSESERLHNWMSAQSGEAHIVLGTRLSVMTPLPRLGLIIVDEEHDASYKQMDGLRYSARDVALVRAKKLGIRIVLGSATPALETYYKAKRGDFGLIHLRHRVNSMPPVIERVNTRQDSMLEGISQTLLRCIGDTIKRREQALVYINRRGYAPVLICRACGWASGCHRCSTRMVVHLRDRRLRCHLCGHEERMHAACPQCGNQDLLPVGHGTQRIEATLERIFPAARILRIDRDTTRRKGAWKEMRNRISERNIDILVGTQILAKGHDFPQLNLVGVINADSSLYSTDFRAAERLFAQLTQVAGRAGRGTSQGHVIIQTEFPGHPLYEALQRGDYPAYAATLLAERKAAGFPPFVFQAVLRAEARESAEALNFLTRAAREGNLQCENVTIYDPVPATLARMGGLERAQLTVQSASRPALQAFLRKWNQQLTEFAARRVRWSIDVDPLEV